MEQIRPWRLTCDFTRVSPCVTGVPPRVTQSPGPPCQAFLMAPPSLLQALLRMRVPLREMGAYWPALCSGLIWD